MNDLSWLLYAASVVGNLQDLMIFFSVVGGMVITVAGITFACTMEEYNAKVHALAAKCVKYTVSFFFASVVLACILPDRNTIYLIAASEMGQKAAQTQTAQKAVAALDRYLDEIGDGTK